MKRELAENDIFDVRCYKYKRRDDEPYTHNIRVSAVLKGVERVVPAAGEDYAFDRKTWARTVEVYVSPTGRSVRIFVDGREVPKP